MAQSFSSKPVENRSSSRAQALEFGQPPPIGGTFDIPPSSNNENEQDGVPVRITAWDVLLHGPVELLKQKRNWLCLMCGATGTGKTYTAIRMAEMIDPRFDVDRIAFSTGQLLDMFDTCKPREIVIFDEANAWNARTSQTKENVEFSKVLAMLRFTLISIIFTLPHIGMIDINGRRLMHNYLYTIPINRSTAPIYLRDKSGVYWYNVESGRLPMGNQKDIPLKFKHPFVKGEKISKVYFSLANPTLLEEYERRKRKWFNATLSLVRKGMAQRAAIEGQPMPQKYMALSSADRSITELNPDPIIPTPSSIGFMRPPYNDISNIINQKSPRKSISIDDILRNTENIIE